MKKLLVRIHLRYLLRGAHYLNRRCGEKQLIIVLAILIGMLAAVAAACLHHLVELFNHLADWLAGLPGECRLAVLGVMLVLPMAGITLSYIVQRTLGGPRYAKSLSPLILALNRKRTSIPLSETVTHILSSSLSVGLGGSAGLEAPSVLTGAAIGANTSSFFGVAKSKRALLLGCGASAAIAAIFDSPIAGVLFAAEVLLPEFSVSALIPMLLSAAVSAVISHVIRGDAQFFLAINAPWRTNAIPYYFICGIFCALAGVYIIRAAYYISEKLKRRFRNPWQRLMVGGGILSVILLLFPALRGQGYGYIGELFAGNVPKLLADSTVLEALPSHPAVLLSVLFVIIFLKVIASVLTVDSGGDGGIFAPSMFIGAVCGFFFARLVNLTGIIELQEYNFVAVGMCGVFTAVMRAPLTGIFLIAEVTGGYILLAPLMIVSSVSFFVARLFEPNSIYRKALVDNDLLNDDREMSLLHQATVRVNVNHTFFVLHADDSLAPVAEAIQRHDFGEIFPVLDEGKLLGVVYLEKILAAMLDMEVYNHLLVFDLMEKAPAVLSPDDDLAKAMKAFDRSGVEALPVCGEDGTFIGFVEKKAIFAKYRNLVKSADNSF